MHDENYQSIDKLLFFGYDQGATAMLYGLAKKELEFLHDVNGVVLMAPCAKMHATKGKTGYTFYSSMSKMSDLLNLHALSGTNWDKIRAFVCVHIATSWCQQDISWEPEYFSHKALRHLLQNGIEDRFQEYSDNYAKNKRFRLTADIPIQNIRHMPVTIMTSDNDDVCPAHQARWIFNKIKTMEKRYILVRNMQHERFATASDEAFMHDIERSMATGSEYGQEEVSIEELMQLYG